MLSCILYVLVQRIYYVCFILKLCNWQDKDSNSLLIADMASALFEKMLLTFKKMLKYNLLKSDLYADNKEAMHYDNCV